MRIVTGNNYYFLRGGSERVFFEEADLLTRHGHEVIPFSVRDPEALRSEYAHHFVDPIDFDSGQSLWRKVRVASRILYSFHSRQKAHRLIESTRPELAHFHNIYHRVSPAVLPVFREHGIPVVLTVHDYKLLCPIYTLYRSGAVCEECSGRRFSSCLRNRCNKGSFSASLVSAAEGYLHDALGLYRRNVDMCIAPSEFLRGKLIAAGWDARHVAHLPNFVDTERLQPAIRGDGYLLYLGRLSHEKGIATLIRAFRGLPGRPSLVVAGGGPLDADARRLADGDDRIRFTGHLGGEALSRTVREARAVVLPSEWYENAPMSALEAMAFGKPVIGARIGGIPEIVREGETGFLFEPGDVVSLREALVRFLALRQTDVEALGRGARRMVESEHAPEGHLRRLMAVYSGARGAVAS
jgi:glycosyltransferase involved in cell wall biosynthesis